MFLISDSYWQVKKTKEKGHGVFAKKETREGTIIGDYLGKVIKTVDYNLDLDKNGLYLMYYTDETSIYPNLKKPGTHLLNHSCRPNCFIYTHMGHTLVFALRKIQKGEEFTISYLLSPKEGCDPCTHTCKCESTFCTGTMHLSKESYKKWQEFQSKKIDNKIPKPVVGKNLEKLTSYPKINPNDPIYKTVIGG